MRKLAFTLAALLLIGGSVMAGSFRVHYSIRGSGRDIMVQAESSAEARRVMDMFPGAVVTGVSQISCSAALNNRRYLRTQAAPFSGRRP